MREFFKFYNKKILNVSSLATKAFIFTGRGPKMNGSGVNFTDLI